jgi:hypothetical protein
MFAFSFRRRWRFVARAARWAVLAAAIPAVWACNARRLVAPTPAPEVQINDLFQQDVNRNIDIVFMVDDSSSMTDVQKKLIAQFPVFMNVLKNLPGGLPNVHIGVVSSSMGAGGQQGIDHCPPGGDQGMFHVSPLGPTCPQGMLNAGQSFIINVNGMANYTGDIADVFTCIAALGENGCGFEHQFESVLRALGADGAPAPTFNAGFLRADAYLAVILLTNEDDCSAPPDSTLFATTSTMVSDPLGPLASYRCNEYGHTCGGKPAPRQPANPPVDLTGMCVSTEDGRELRVRDVAAALKSLKKDPSKVLVAAIAGPPAPYIVNVGPAEVRTDPNMWAYVEHSCMAMDGTYADPAIRISEWVDAFGANGVFEDMCADSFAPALQRIAQKIGMTLGSPCVTGKVLDTTGAVWAPTGMTPPDCTVIDHQTNAQGNVVDSVLPPCTPGQNTGATACWHLDQGAGATCAGSFVMGFNRPGAAMTTELNSSVSCSVLACPPPGTGKPPQGC